MTGNILMRLREAYGFKQADVARAGGTIYKALDNIERQGGERERERETLSLSFSRSLLSPTVPRRGASLQFS